MNLRNHDRRHSIDSRRLLKVREVTSVMQDNSDELGTQAGNGLSLNLQPELLARTPAAGSSGSSEAREVRVSVDSEPGEASGRSSSRRQRTSAHSHAHCRARARSHSQTEPGPAEPDLESGDQNASFSELRYLFRWVQKSLPFIVILCAKLVIQHALGLAVGVGLFTTFLYANKNIKNQVFLQERRSKLHCLWLLLFLTLSTLLIYHTFQTETLYYCLILVSPRAESLGFWEVLWTVGVTNFILKFIFMGLKCLILILPVRLMTFKSRGSWYMFIEETGQVYQTIAPVPVWFRYLIAYQDVEGSTGLTFGILLALGYLILKLLGLYGHWGSIQRTFRIFFNNQNGAAATKNQCSEAGDVCPICQASFRDPRVLLCQHIFCDECISLWFNREKTCPLCRTAITDKVHKWKDGAASPHLQVY